MPDLTTKIEALVARYGGDEPALLRSELRILVSVVDVEAKLEMVDLVSGTFAEQARVRAEGDVRLPEAVGEGGR